MLLNLSEDQEFFRETTTASCPSWRRRTRCARLRDDPAGFDPPTGAGAPSWGGRRYWSARSTAAGPSAAEGWSTQSVAYEFGRHAAPGPLVTANVVAETLSAHGRGPDVLAACSRARRSRRGARPTPARRMATDRRGEDDGTDLVLRGAVRPVEAAGTAAHLLVTCGDGGGTTRCWCPSAPASRCRRWRRSTSPVVSRSSTFDDVRVPADVVVGVTGKARDGRRPSVPGVLVMLNAEAVGAMQAGFDMTVEWAFDRYSFGRPLASYQA